jgi:hypothetical protein
MSETTVSFPVTCPKCGRKRLAELPVDIVANTLRRGAHLYLAAACHNIIWDATDVEREQLRECLGGIGVPLWKLEPSRAN